MYAWLGHYLFVKSLVCAVTTDYIESPIHLSVSFPFAVAFQCNFATQCNPYQKLRYNSNKTDHFDTISI